LVPLVEVTEEVAEAAAGELWKFAAPTMAGSWSSGKFTALCRLRTAGSEAAADWLEEPDEEPDE
jgi:hypothetical protein